jgi:hypothetical protein
LPLRASWSQDELSQIILPASELGEARIKFSSLDEARKFRFACYNLRKRTGIGKGLSFILDETNTNGSDQDQSQETSYEVIIMKTPVFEITRHI